MSQTLQAGGNVSINDFSGTVVISHDIDIKHDINLTAFLLTDVGKVQGDSSVVFFNQPREPNGAAVFIPPVESANTKTHRIDFDLKKIPTGINKIAVTLTEDNCNTFATVKNLKAEIRVGNQAVQLVPNGFSSENGIIVSELYIRNSQPKVRAVWQGFASGLDGLCVHYGVEVAEESNNNASSNSSEPSANNQPLGVLERIQTFLGFETATEKRAKLERERLEREEVIRQQEETRLREIAAKEQRRANLIAQYGDKGNQLDAMIDRYGSRFESIESVIDMIDMYDGNIDVLTKIMNRELWIGQTDLELLDSRGYPDATEEKVMAKKTREIWKYDEIGANRFRLKVTLENDVVTGWEEK